MGSEWVQGVRRRLLLATCVAVAAAMCVLPAHALAAGLNSNNSFNELTKGESEATTSQSTTASTSSSSATSNSGSLLLVGSVVAIVLLGGIAFAIMRDARRVAPAPGGPVAEGRSSRGDPAARLRHRRARAKAARQQRKRNR